MSNKQSVGTSSTMIGISAPHTASFTKFKLHLNSTIFTPGTKYCTLGKNFFFIWEHQCWNTNIWVFWSQWSKTSASISKILTALCKTDVSCSSYVKTCIGFPKQVWYTTNSVNTSTASGTPRPSAPTTSLPTIHVSVILVVDNLDGKYKRQEDLANLHNATKQIYTTNIDVSNNLYCGLTLT